MVGGGTRMPMIKAILLEMIGKEPMTTMNMDEAVVRGAAMQVENLFRISKRVHLVCDIVTNVSRAGIQYYRHTTVSYSNSLPEGTRYRARVNILQFSHHL